MKHKLIDINNIDKVHPSMLDNENRKLHYADMIMEIVNNISIKLIKCRFCTEGLYYHETFLDNFIKEQDVKIENILSQLKELTDKNSDLQQKLMEEQKIKKWWQIWK